MGDHITLNKLIVYIGCFAAAVLWICFIVIGPANHQSSSGAAIAKSPIAPVATRDPSLRFRALPAGSIICSSPFKLNEALYAGDDEKWLKSLDCIRARGGMPAMWLDQASFGVKVRVTLPNGEGITAWTTFGPVDYCGDSPCPPPPQPAAQPAPPPRPAAKPETGTSARWVCQKTTIVNRSGSSPITCGFQTPPEDVK